MDENSGDESFDVDWDTDDELEIYSGTTTASQPALVSCTDIGEASSSSGPPFKLINHFTGMGFTEQMVLKAIEEYGYEDTESILNTLLTYATLEEYPELQPPPSPPQQQSPLSPRQQQLSNSDSSTSDYIDTFMDDFSDVDDSWSENEEKPDIVSEQHKRLLLLANMGTLSEEEKKLLDLANMGYTVEEASIAMDRCGKEASISVLTDFISAAQMSREEDCYLPNDDLKPKRVFEGSSSKKRKYHDICRKKNVNEDTITLPNPMIGFGIPSMQLERVHRSLPESARGPPYFYYENVARATKGDWDAISRNLYEIKPEFVDSKYFSATARKRGYVHNLPITNRFPLVPLPPMTIQQAFPLTKNCWPTWDERVKLNCIQTSMASAKLTERLRRLLERCDGIPHESVQREILDECRKWNLVWVGTNKLAPLECDEVEMLLGFPKNHTRGGGISRTDRYKSLGNSFQVDTVAYHLSVLKDMYPNGINLLSLFSGIGGAEVALHRLGIKLKNVVSIEKLKANRDIVRSWWDQTNQKGKLIDFEDVRSFDARKIEGIVSSIGHFDLVVGGSPCNNLSGGNRHSRDGLEGPESILFYDYCRILKDVRFISRQR
ncbi:hypothetical protein CASFOL_029888 [Castilleja foliolosa]|uniref:DNA (cytosine-5-)-methyltransferase n=1 Tax=Castilleja foliolosa TaxID=1961234 RepID=A0ABD3C9Q9_9LAMI